MFCDLVGSTSLAAKLDAEDWRNLVNAYLDEASEAVTGLGGHVAEEARRRADGALRLSARRRRTTPSARCGPRSRSSARLPNSTPGTPPRARRSFRRASASKSGPVVVEATGEVFGDAPNIAARVQAAAEPGSVLVTIERAAPGRRPLRRRGAAARTSSKASPSRSTLYRIVRASGGRRFGARTLTPLVGREEELDLLRRRWERAVRGEGQLALIVGEPGIGKSRLVEEFR